MTSESGSTGELGETKKTFDWCGAAPEGVVCPGCLGELRGDAGTLVCGECGRRYPVVDGIPVLIVERGDKAKAG
jgi:uncharacterized protein YbaR (Trm112 family)